MVRSVLLAGAVCITIAGLVALVLGLATLARADEQPRLTIADQPVSVPPAGLFGGFLQVYTAAPVERSPRELGCALVDDRGREQPPTRLDQLGHVLGEPVTLDGVTWHPLTEVSLASRAATLSCPGVSSRLAVADGGVFGSDSRTIGAFATGTGVLFVLVGVIGTAVLVPSGGRSRGWPGRPSVSERGPGGR